MQDEVWIIECRQKATNGKWIDCDVPAFHYPGLAELYLESISMDFPQNEYRASRFIRADAPRKVTP